MRFTHGIHILTILLFWGNEFMCMKMSRMVHRTFATVPKNTKDTMHRGIRPLRFIHEKI